MKEIGISHCRKLNFSDGVHGVHHVCNGLIITLSKRKEVKSNFISGVYRGTTSCSEYLFVAIFIRNMPYILGGITH